MNNQFSIDPVLCKTEVANLDTKIEELNDQLTDIFQRAVVNGVPVAQVIVSQFQATPKDLKMLSKVFDRLAVLIAQQNDLVSKRAALNFITEKNDWVYETVGAPQRDVEHFLATLNTETID